MNSAGAVYWSKLFGKWPTSNAPENNEQKRKQSTRKIYLSTYTFYFLFPSRDTDALAKST